MARLIVALMVFSSPSLDRLTHGQRSPDLSQIATIVVPAGATSVEAGTGLAVAVNVRPPSGYEVQLIALALSPVRGAGQYVATPSYDPGRGLWIGTIRFGSIAPRGAYSLKVYVTVCPAGSVVVPRSCQTEIRTGAAVTVTPSKRRDDRPPARQEAGLLEATAVFAGEDRATRGEWKGVYGSEGAIVAGDREVPPTFVRIELRDHARYIWAAATSDRRAPARTTSRDRIAATWYAAETFAVDVRMLGNEPKTVSLFFLDWDATDRAQRIDVYSAGASSERLDTRTLSRFNQGVYLRWTVTGQVVFRLSRLAGANAVLSGLFFDQPQPNRKGVR